MYSNITLQRNEDRMLSKNNQNKVTSLADGGKLLRAAALHHYTSPDDIDSVGGDLLSSEKLESLHNLDLPDIIFRKLFDYQRVGVNWMYTLFLRKIGGVLGDDMGMGKTLQVVSLLVGLMSKNLVKSVLILAPVAVLPGWYRELLSSLIPLFPEAKVDMINSDVSKKKRERILEEAFIREGSSIVVSSHQLTATMTQSFTSHGVWDYVILDEGHIIKNPSTKLSKAMHMLRSHHRLLLTGTPIQNNLTEFWAVMEWATKGRCFGSLKTFNSNIAEPILKGQQPKALQEHRYAAEIAMQNLVQLCRPLFLQRKKTDYLLSTLNYMAKNGLPEKKEFVVWISLSSLQKKQYQEYLASSAALAAFRRDNYPVEVINSLKVLCKHPLLLQISNLNKGTRLEAEEDDGICDLASSLGRIQITDQTKSYHVRQIHDLPDHMIKIKTLMKGSIKLRILLHFVTTLLDKGHRLLIFSQSKRMLQIIQLTLAEYSIPTYTISGSTNFKERQIIIDDFNHTGEDYSGPRVCLLTTKACGVGITLTGADRVIVYDPSWNPAEDNQAVDRAYRIGQRKSVIVYRFIHVGCVEQKVYEKQVFKEGLREVSEKGRESKKYFAGQNDLTNLLKLEENSAPFFSKLHSRLDDLVEDEIVQESKPVYGVMGVTRHDKLYRKRAEPIVVNVINLADSRDSIENKDNHIAATCVNNQRQQILIDLVEAESNPANAVYENKLEPILNMIDKEEVHKQESLGKNTWEQEEEREGKEGTGNGIHIISQKYFEQRMISNERIDLIYDEDLLISTDTLSTRSIDDLSSDSPNGTMSLTLTPAVISDDSATCQSIAEEISGLGLEEQSSDEEENCTALSFPLIEINQLVATNILITDCDNKGLGDYGGAMQRCPLSTIPDSNQTSEQEYASLETPDITHGKIPSSSFSSSFGVSERKTNKALLAYSEPIIFSPPPPLTPIPQQGLSYLSTTSNGGFCSDLVSQLGEGKHDIITPPLLIQPYASNQDCYLSQAQTPGMLSKRKIVASSCKMSSVRSVNNLPTRRDSFLVDQIPE